MSIISSWFDYLRFALLRGRFVSRSAVRNSFRRRFRPIMENPRGTFRASRIHLEWTCRSHLELE